MATSEKETAGKAKPAPKEPLNPKPAPKPAPKVTPKPLVKVSTTVAPGPDARSAAIAKLHGGVYPDDQRTNDAIRVYWVPKDSKAADVRLQGSFFCNIARYHHYMRDQARAVPDEAKRVRAGLQSIAFEGAPGSKTPGGLSYLGLEFDWHALDAEASS